MGRLIPQQSRSVNGVACNNGKGPVVASTGAAASQNIPASERHIHRNPPCFEAAQDELFATCATAGNLPTRSQVMPLPNFPVAGSAAELFNKKKAEALQAFAQIVAACGDKKKFFDSSFYLGEASNLYPAGTPEDSCVGEPQTIVRIEDTVPSGTPLGGSNFTDLVASDLQQQQLGSLFLLSSVAAIAAHAQANKNNNNNNGSTSNLIQHLFVAADTQRSVYAVMFCVMGVSYEWVIIDGTVCADAENKVLYTKSSKNTEMWPALLEKAFAKLHGSYDAIDGGSSAAAAATLTGGVRRKLPELSKMRWREFVRIVSNPLNVVTATVREAGAGGNAASNQQHQQGLVLGYSYAVLAAKQTKDKRGFVRLAGRGGDAPGWTGPWSASDAKSWTENAEVAAELGFNANDNTNKRGDFWMSACDFKSKMNLEVTRLVPENDSAFTFSNVSGTGASGRVGVAQTMPDDIFVLKLEKSQKIDIIVGQCDGRFAVTLNNNGGSGLHKIAKGLGDLPTRSWSVGVRASHHTQGGAPTGRSFARSPKALLASTVSTGAECVIVEDVAAPAGYVSIEPMVDEGTPYYVRVVLRDSNNGVVSMFQLSTGKKGAVLSSDAAVAADPRNKLQLELEPQLAEGAENEWPSDADDDEDVAVAAGKGEGDDEDDDEDDEAAWDDGLSNRKRFTKQQLDAMFDQADIDGSGWLDSRAETFSALLLLDPTASPRRIQFLVRQADASGDGRISRKEWYRLAKELANEM